MAKQSGLGSQLYWGTATTAYDISGDIGALTGAVVERAALDVTGIDKSAHERVLSRRDGSLSFTSFWNTTAGQAHPVLSALPTSDVYATACAGTPAVGAAAFCLVGKQTGYAPSLGADGSLAASISASGNAVPGEWGELLTTGKQTFASGTVNGASIDLGAASTAFGCAAWLTVFSLGSGTPTVTIKDSADNSTFAALSPTSLAWTPTAAGCSRLITGLTATVRQYVRVEVTGTYTSLVACLNFVRFTESAA